MACQLKFECNSSPLSSFFFVNPPGAAHLHANEADQFVGSQSKTPANRIQVAKPAYASHGGDANMDPYQSKKCNNQGRSSRPLSQEAEEEGGPSTVGERGQTLSPHQPGETATTTSPATGTPSFQRSESRAKNFSLNPSQLEFRARDNTATSFIDSAATRGTGRSDFTCHPTSARDALTNRFHPARSDAISGTEQWNDGWDLKDYQRRRIYETGHFGAARDGPWEEKRRHETSFNKGTENVKMVGKRSGPWARPPPPTQQRYSPCMTCNKMLGYPSDTEEYRCKICATVNYVLTLEEKAAAREAECEKLLKGKKKSKTTQAEANEHYIPQGE